MVNVSNTNAKDLRIDLGRRKRFETLEFTSIGSGNAGLYRAGRLLYADDLISGIEIALSRERLDKLWEQYTTDLRQRKIGDHCKELHLATRWSTGDILSRLEREYEGKSNARFIVMPALDENDESNFQYTINGFSTEYYREMREKLNDAEWQAKYQQRPYVREGLLFQSDDLRYFNGILPDGDHRIVAVVDVAWGGGDSLSMPIGAEYENGDVYIFAWVFNKGTKEVTIPLVTGSIVANDIRQIRFEGNTGGDLYSQYVDEKLREQKFKCSCSSRKAPSTLPP
jgi:hypothetical protein